MPHARMLIRIPSSFAICLMLGWLAGMMVGHMLFADLEREAGELLADIAFGIVGAVFGGLLHEVAVSLLRLD
jgi:hypothetical protein